MIKFNRVYRQWHLWEEVSANMWGTVENKAEWVRLAIEFTGDHKKYGEYMLRVILEWPVSCENALTDYSLNRNAWVGHAACALALGCPEHITREAWGTLTNEQQLLANNEARFAIQTWENAYAKSKGIRNRMDDPMLF